jgi:hypothetical protein
MPGDPPAEDPVAFWCTDPNVLLSRDHAFEFFPVESMSFNQKLNAVTRSVVMLSILMFFTYRNGRLLVVCALTLVAICLIHRMKTRARAEDPEPFESQTDAAAAAAQYSDETLYAGGVFQTPDTVNPFANVLPTDYDDAAAKKPAAPASNSAANQYIIGSVLDQTDQMHPDFPGMSAELLTNNFEKLQFEQSMRPFYSTASTTIPNDQSAFADFCYGTMMSCRDNNGYSKPCGTGLADATSCGDGSNGFACARNATRYNLY